MGNNTGNTIATILPIILGSSLLTALLSSMTSFFKSSRDSKIENITQERASWRERIRNISKNLESSKEVTKTLNEIKLNINPFGQLPRNITNEDEFNLWIKEDGYVWDAIKEVESNPSKKNIGKIIEALGILLKLDWERSKKEIKGERLINFIAISIFLYYTIFISIVTLYILDGVISTTHDQKILAISIAMVSFLIVAPWFWVVTIKGLYSFVDIIANVQNEYKKKQMGFFVHKFVWVGIVLLIIFLTVLFAISIFSPILSSGFFISNFGKNETVLLGALMTLCALAASFCYQKNIEPKILEIMKLKQILIKANYKNIEQSNYSKKEETEKKEENTSK